ncbi:MAG TPA: VCBS repeat-containing protein, partial [Planctomycetaceae bacterium]|nr:VCBS repeat-containing protein [Planctomycetaceae bacterium]
PADPAGALRSAVPVKLTGTKRQLISLALRERPPVRIDRLLFFDRTGHLRLSLEAEEASNPTEADIAVVPAKRFWIEWPDAPELTVKRSHPKGIVVPVCKLYQRMSRRLRAGESVELANVLSTDKASGSHRCSLERIGRGAVLLDAGEPALCALRDAKVDGLAFDAEMLYLSPTRIAWADGRTLRLDAWRIASRTACNLEFDLTGKKIIARSADGKPVKVQTTGRSDRAVRELLDRLRKSLHAGDQRDTTPTRSSSGRQRAAPPASVRPTWRLELAGGAPLRRLKQADLDGDGRFELLVAHGNRACAVSAAGRLLWSYSLAGPCYDIEAGELVADRPGREVAVAGGDTYVHLLDARGKLVSKHQIRGAVWNQNFGDRPWQADTVGVRDLDRDGTNEILVGTQNYELHLYDARWRMLARTRRAVLHGSIDFLTADADGDGKLEIFATDHYGRVQAFEHDGTKAAAFYTSIGDMQATLVDLDGDGRIELVYGSSTGDLVATKLPPGRVSGRGAKTLWRFDNFGYAVNRLRAADLDADGKPEVAVASGSGYLYVLDSGGKVEWQDRAGTDIVETVLLHDAPARLAYLDLGGTLTLASGDGSLRKRLPLAIAPRVASVLRGTLVIGSDGHLSAFSIRELLQASGWSRTK